MIGLITILIVSVSPPPKPSPHRGTGRRDLYALEITAQL